MPPYGQFPLCGAGKPRRALAGRPNDGEAMEALTRAVLRHRWLVLVVWLAIFVVAGFASSRLADLLTNRFTLPGTDTYRAEQILREDFGQRSTGSFTVVVASEGRARVLVPRVREAA